MNHRETPRIALTIGDINGIGIEVMVRALADENVRRLCHPIIIGNRHLIRDYLQALLLSESTGGSFPRATVDDSGLRIDAHTFPVVEIESDAQLRPGQIDNGAGRLAGDAIAQATRMAIAGEVDAIVTMPIAKTALHAGGHNFPGHTEMIAAMTGGTPLMVLMTEGLRVGLCTIHVPITAIPSLITRDLVTSRIRQLATMLRHDFAIEEPRIAVLALNPHAGESGAIGTEEMEIIEPAIRAMQHEGIDADGPHPADGFFARYTPDLYDAVLAMYHDQGLIPLKMFARGHGVNVTANLPIVRTSPDHGTAFNIAGRGVADASSVVEAVRIAVEMVNNRRREE